MNNLQHEDSDGQRPPTDDEGIMRMPKKSRGGGGSEEAAAAASPLEPDPGGSHGHRVCADCSTTKTPLWRSGPKGPKSLCNACGIRQRKARRAIEAAAAATVEDSGLFNKKKAKHLAAIHSRVSTEDDRDAAILLMALSLGLIHG
ncbi:hypothetical protein M569_14364 [Genlisea aurea]|uniref:GATA-type domain-containing protein n=1 Tax=Genlisea aurea TaxID=192259 RepID=S8DLL4_9LAMI|nr:hypothetical protein M569_14364 [Genlisea aurea]